MRWCGDDVGAAVRWYSDDVVWRRRCGVAATMWCGGDDVVVVVGAIVR